MNKLQEIFSAPKFIGTFNKLPMSANVGDVCVVNNTTYIYGFGWNKINELSFKLESHNSRIENKTLILDVL